VTLILYFFNFCRLQLSDLRRESCVIFASTLWFCNSEILGLRDYVSARFWACVILSWCVILVLRDYVVALYFFCVILSCVQISCTLLTGPRREKQSRMEKKGSNLWANKTSRFEHLRHVHHSRLYITRHNPRLDIPYCRSFLQIKRIEKAFN
jgi:hypothetical protein